MRGGGDEGDLGPASTLSGLLSMCGYPSPQAESTVAVSGPGEETPVRTKARLEHFDHQIRPVLHPCIVVLLPPWPWRSSFWPRPVGIWLPRALNFLVVSMPLRHLISIPLSFLERATAERPSSGIFSERSNYLEALAQAGVVVFDKTAPSRRAVRRQSRPPEGMREGAAGAGRPRWVEQFFLNPLETPPSPNPVVAPGERPDQGGRRGGGGGRPPVRRASDRRRTVLAGNFEADGSGRGFSCLRSRPPGTVIHCGGGWHGM